jgi:hypothetical protein
VQGSFAPPVAEAVKDEAEPNSDEEEQGEAGDYFEITRYGGQGQASLGAYIHPPTALL